MLVLSRKKNTRILIGDNIVITIVEVRGETVKVGIEAPRELNIIREELIGVEPSDKNETSHTQSHKSGAADTNSPAAIGNESSLADAGAGV